MVDNREDVNIRTFNQAKLYAEQILFPMMYLYHKFERQSDFGSEDLNSSLLWPEDIRDIERFNGLKGMNDILLSLARTIGSTIRLKGNKIENLQLVNIITSLEKLSLNFYENKHRFFESVFKDGKQIEIIERTYFEYVKKCISICYVNTEILMTKNKLLFSDQSDDYLTDRDIMEQIKSEYVEG